LIIFLRHGIFAPVQKKRQDFYRKREKDRYPTVFIYEKEENWFIHIAFPSSVPIGISNEERADFQNVLSRIFIFAK